MKRKTSELTSAALDWAAAVANGVQPEEIYISGASVFRRLRDEDGRLDGRYMTGPDLLFSRKWEAGGPVIDRERIALNWLAHAHPEPQWMASHAGGYTSPSVPRYGPTPLIAAMRCFVASKLGDEVDIPEELLQT